MYVHCSELAPDWRKLLLLAQQVWLFSWVKAGTSQKSGMALAAIYDSIKIIPVACEVYIISRWAIEIKKFEIFRSVAYGYPY